MYNGKKKYISVAIVIVTTCLIGLQSISAEKSFDAEKSSLEPINDCQIKPPYQLILGYDSGENNTNFVQAGIIFGEQFNLTKPIILLRTRTKMGTENAIGGGDIYFNIYRCGKDYLPIGDSLVTSRVSIENIPIKTYGWVYENYSPTILFPGKYAVTASYEGAMTRIGWKMEAPGLYENGTGIQNLGIWSTSPVDFMFDVYGFYMGF